MRTSPTSSGSATRSTSTSPSSPCPAHAAQSIIDRLVGLEPPARAAVLNFAPVKVFAPRDVVVRQVDFSSELMFLSFYLDREA